MNYKCQGITASPVQVSFSLAFQKNSCFQALPTLVTTRSKMTYLLPIM